MNITANAADINVQGKTAQVFQFKQSHEIRIQVIDGEPWFALRDVCDTLDLKVASPERFQLDSKGVTKLVIPTTSGDQELTFVNEPNLYRVIFRSNKPEAKQFQDWVFSEVLPAIRKQGSYTDTHNKMGTLIGETIGTNGFNMLGALIKGKVTGLARESQGRARSKIWAQTHAAFGVRSAADIPASQLDAARNFIAAYALEGEWLGKEKPMPCAMALDENSAANLRALCHHAEWLLRNWNATLAPALRHVRSQIEADFHEHFVSAGLLARNLATPAQLVERAAA